MSKLQSSCYYRNVSTDPLETGGGSLRIRGPHFVKYWSTAKLSQLPDIGVQGLPVKLIVAQSVYTIVTMGPTDPVETSPQIRSISSPIHFNINLLHIFKSLNRSLPLRFYN